jgi:Holliday junction resolvase
MTNTRAKGCRIENLAKRVLESEGWLVYRVPASRMWQKEEDVFGLWDLLAVKGREYKFVQVKSNQRRDMKPLQLFAKEHFNPFVRFELWVYKDRTGWDEVLL